MSHDRRRIGKLGENEACLRLQASGYTIREMNWRCRSGEIDIIAELEGRIVFIEVRTRRLSGLGRFGTAAESIDYRKQQQVRRVAQSYMQFEKLLNRPIRFDAIAISLAERDRIHSFVHYEAAF
ncbi:YraN family protein [Paenibacillus sp. HB172176]|uniref:YraN family protein n=1 Tax=Paenibacillus sp. HB172176 TaxID=2493690 RepID=UPI001438F478|nr:YraN family protein [Paenibacillus sp. HB172176]